MTYGYGRCGLAANRDFWDEDAGRFACGFNPGAPADDTLLVGRVTGGDGAILATLFNYACHPTTLAWDNRLLSPDYIGAAREVLEHAFGAPALFFHGASGELAPRDDYVGDTAVADRNGRQLGHAAAAAIEALPPAGTRFVYTGIVASGANLGTWEYRPCEPAQLAESSRLAAQLTEVELRRKDEPAIVESLTDAKPDAVQEREKALRRAFLELALGDGPTHRMPLWTWRLGEALLVAVPNELYSEFQVELRRRFEGVPVFVLTTTNGGVGYLCPRETLRQRAATRSSSRPTRPAASRRRSTPRPMLWLASSAAELLSHGESRPGDARAASGFGVGVEPPRISLARGIQRASRRGSERGHPPRPAGLGRFDLGRVGALRRPRRVRVRPRWLRGRRRRRPAAAAPGGRHRAVRLVPRRSVPPRALPLRTRAGGCGRRSASPRPGLSWTSESSSSSPGRWSVCARRCSGRRSWRCCRRWRGRRAS